MVPGQAVKLGCREDGKDADMPRQSAVGLTPVLAGKLCDCELFHGTWPFSAQRTLNEGFRRTDGARGYSDVVCLSLLRHTAFFYPQELLGGVPIAGAEDSPWVRVVYEMKADFDKRVGHVKAKKIAVVFRRIARNFITLRMLLQLVCK